MKHQTRFHLLAGLLFAAAIVFLLWNFNAILGSFLESGKAMPVRAVSIDGVLTHVTTREIADLVGRKAGGRNIASVESQEIRDALLEDPWISRAVVRKKMPDTIVVSVVEHVPAAYWNDSALYDAQNQEIFSPALAEFKEPLVRLGAFRDNLAPEVYQSAVEYIKILRGSSYHLVALYLDQVRCYTLTLSSGTRIILGRGRDKTIERLQRFLRALPQSGIKLDDVSYVDLRYDVGFATGPLKSSDVLGEGKHVGSATH